MQDKGILLRVYTEKQRAVKNKANTFSQALSFQYQLILSFAETGCLYTKSLWSRWVRSCEMPKVFHQSMLMLLKLDFKEKRIPIVVFSTNKALAYNFACSYQIMDLSQPSVRKQLNNDWTQAAVIKKLYKSLPHLRSQLFWSATVKVRDWKLRTVDCCCF